jgi:hypothetical protein
MNKFLKNKMSNSKTIDKKLSKIQAEFYRDENIRLKTELSTSKVQNFNMSNEVFQLSIQNNLYRVEKESTLKTSLLEIMEENKLFSREAVRLKQEIFDLYKLTSIYYCQQKVVEKDKEILLLREELSKYTDIVPVLNN